MSVSFGIVVFAFLWSIYQCVAIALYLGSFQKWPALWMGNYSHIGAVVGCTACVWGGSFLGQVEMSSVRTEGHCKNQWVRKSRLLMGQRPYREKLVSFHLHNFCKITEVSIQRRFKELSRWFHWQQTEIRWDLFVSVGAKGAEVAAVRSLLWFGCAEPPFHVCARWLEQGQRA